MSKRFWCLLVAILAGSLLAAPLTTSAQEQFYKDKTVRIIVGFSAGGGFDTYARAIARHMRKHIPGNPAIIVENMTGAGSMIAANHVYKVAKPDGLTIGHFIGSLLLGQVLGQEGIEFDARKFEHIGAPVKDYVACALSKESGVTSVAQWASSKTPLKLGGTGRGGTIDNALRVFKVALGLPVQIISPYKGTADIRIAVEAGELAGSCWEWYGMRTAWSKALEAGKVVVVLQAAPKPFSDLPKVPLAIDLVKTQEGRQLIEAGVHDPGSIARPYVLPPGTPKAQLLLLRKAFLDTMKDPEFLAEAKKARLQINPLEGEEMERIVGGLFRLSPALASRLKEVLLK